MKLKKEKKINTRDWKEKNKSYLKHLQKFLDATDSIKDEELKRHIITQMLKCDLALTQIAENQFEKIKKSIKNK